MEPRGQDCFDIPENLCRRAIRRNLMKIPVRVMHDDWGCQLFIGFQPGPNHFFVIVRAPNQGCSLDIANSPFLRRLKKQIVNTSTLGALTAGRDALDEHRLRCRQMKNRGLRETQFHQFPVKKLGLRQCARVSVQEEAALTIFLRDAADEHFIHQLVADQLTSRQDVLRLLSKGRTGNRLPPATFRRWRWQGFPASA